VSNALEQSFADICAKHELTCLSIALMVDYDETPPRGWFNACLQWRDRSKEHGLGGVSSSADTIAAALSSATELMVAKRHPDLAGALADEPLLVEG